MRSWDIGQMGPTTSSPVSQSGTGGSPTRLTHGWNPDSGSAYRRNITIEECMIKQTPTTPDDFWCARCKNYKGGVGCKANVLICFKGGNTSGCFAFKESEPK